MLFNSIDFAIFLPLVFIVYWFVLNKNLKIQNAFVFIASYVFYGWWDWRFLFLIFLSTIIDYIVGRCLLEETNEIKRKRYLWFSIFVNLSLLGFFKYYNFFIDSFISGFTFFGSTLEVNRLQIILPFGISFYTFQTLSYTIDVYRKRMAPTTDFIAFGAFISFFPQLVAGPIERASNLLPQFNKKRVFEYERAKSGVQLIVWGLFKKIVVADNAGLIVDGIYGNFESQSSFSLIFGTLLFSFQVYCDFSGYSDIAIGTARLFGFDLMTNFKFPFFSKNIKEFWNRWHISLSTWFRDYIYIPLGGNRVSKYRVLFNLFMIFFVSGFWHGADWTFILWGVAHGFLFIGYYLYDKKYGSVKIKYFKKTRNFLSRVITYLSFTILLIMFRSQSLDEVLDYFQFMISANGNDYFFMKTKTYVIMTINALLGVTLILGVEWYYYKKGKDEVLLPSFLLSLIVLLICFFGAFKDQSEFFYFQF